MSDHEKLREALRSTEDAWSGDSYVKVPYPQWFTIREAAESTLPKTKMETVWHVEWVYQRTPDSAREPRVSVLWTKESADLEALSLRESNSPDRPHWHCIRVTGPHQQEVPA